MPYQKPVNISVEEARAVQCRGRLLVNVALDPNPNTYEELTAEYNCVNCDTHDVCLKVQEAVES